MIRQINLLLCILLLASTFTAAEKHITNFPAKIVISRHTFFDVGPPFNFYEIFVVDRKGNDLSIERALVTPPGDACTQPPTVEVQTGTLHNSMAELFKGKNPCEISDKALHQELNRCKKCLKFSGVDVTLHIRCGEKNRELRMDILDQDMFDQKPNTPQYTSWTMTMMAKLDHVLGPSVMKKPAFAAITPDVDASELKQPDMTILRALRNGEFDDFFNSEPQISELAREAQKAPHQPSVEFLNFSPFNPVSAELPKYPPIAKAAHIDGLVTITFEISSLGKTENLSFISGPRFLQGAVASVVKNWGFPEVAFGRHEQATIEFKMNCNKTRPHRSK